MSSVAQKFVVHYGEIALRKGNRRVYERRLAGNILSRLRTFEGAQVRLHYGRMFVDFPKPVDAGAVAKALSQVFGIANFSPVVSVARDMKAISEEARAQLRRNPYKTFAVRAHRVDKTYELNSVAINRAVGAYLLEQCGGKVNLDAPEAEVFIDVLHREVLVYSERFEGLRGLPVGSSAKVLCLVSGGIDSPVAVLRMLKRGCTAVLLHFHSAPLTDSGSQQKVEEFAELLVDYQRPVKLYKVALAPIQQEVVRHADSKYRILLYRRYMMRIAEQIARQEKAKALVTGESLGQVASQTVENMNTVADTTSLQIFRPLLGMDKDEIVSEARKFKTFELSIEAGQDCCSFMSTRNPAIKSRAVDLRGQEALLQSKADMAALVDQAVAQTKVQVFK